MMNRTLPEVISDIFIHHGAVMEEEENGCVEFISPSTLSESLGIPEYGKLAFKYNAPYDEAIHATYDSELFRRLGRLFKVRGRFSSAICPSYVPDETKLSKTVSERIVLSNATFRMDRTEIGNITYLLVLIRYVAMSDDKHEGLFPLLINELNLSSASQGGKIGDIMEDLKESEYKPPQPGQETIKALKSAYSAASLVVRERLVDFIKSLERRLNRDIRRVYEYYDTLKDETIKTSERRALSRDKMLNKLQAIEAEQKWKIQDLISKYAMDVEIKHVSAIRIETQSRLIWINIMRRQKTRPFPLSYNPLLRQIDPLPCESCFYPRGGYYICDDNLHIVCAGCFKRCDKCGRRYCAACYKDGCPKCKKK